MKRGPRTSRTYRTTVGYDPSKPSATNRSKIDVDNNLGFTRKIASTRSRQNTSITRVSSVFSRADGGPPAASHFDTVAG